VFNFPDNPTYGQVYQLYTWDGEKWILTVGGVPAPPPPAPGDGYTVAVGALRGGFGSVIIAEFNDGKTTFV